MTKKTNDFLDGMVFGSINKKQWYEQVDFISRDMQFYSLSDFYESAEWIVYCYDNMKSTGKRLYKWYVWAKPYLKNDEKELIWNIVCGVKSIPKAYRTTN